MKLLRTNFKAAILAWDEEINSWRKDAVSETFELVMTMYQRECHRFRVLDNDFNSILMNKYFDSVKDDIKEIQNVRKSQANTKHKNGNKKTTYHNQHFIESSYLSGNLKCIYHNGKLIKKSDHDSDLAVTLFEIPLNDNFRYDGTVVIRCNHPFQNRDNIWHEITVDYINGKQDGEFSLGIRTRNDANFTPLISIKDMKNWKADGVVQIEPVSCKLAMATRASYISDTHNELTYGNNKLRNVKIRSDDTGAELGIELTDQSGRVIFKDNLAETIIYEDGSAENLTLWAAIPFSKGQRLGLDQPPIEADTIVVHRDLLFNVDAQKQTIKLSEQSKDDSIIKAMDQQLIADWI